MGSFPDQVPWFLESNPEKRLSAKQCLKELEPTIDACWNQLLL